MVATVLFIVAILVMIAGMINWVWVGLPAHVNISGNSTITPNEIAAQTVPTIINGITTSTNVIIAFSAAFSGILIGYVFKDDNRERDVIMVVLSVFPLPLIFEFFAFSTLAGGQGLFDIGLRLALVSFLYSLFALITIFIITTYRLYERGKKSILKKEETPANPPSATTEPEKIENENRKTDTKPHEDRVFELVQWIDEHESKVIKFYDAFGGMEKTLVIVLVVLFFVSEVVNLTISDFATKISIQLASFAVLITFISFVFQIGEKRILESRFRRALKLKTFGDREKPLLKALIQIKSNNEEIKLMTIYEMSKEAHGNIFTEKNLLESICK